MSAVTFQTQIGDDGIIHVPDEFKIGSGLVQVTVQPLEGPREESPGEHLFDRLARIADSADTSNLPPDLAENHDHYLHGLSKEID